MWLVPLNIFGSEKWDKFFNNYSLVIDKKSGKYGWCLIFAEILCYDYILFRIFR